MKLLCCAIPALVLAISLPANSQHALPRRAFGDSDESFADKTAALLAALEHAEQWELYEGLPSEWEAKGVFENERRTKQAVQLDDNWFYLRSQAVAEEDRQNLRRLYAARLFEPWGGTKLCGGFHGDYALSFQSGDVIHVVIFCLGCHEARILTMPAAEATTSPKTISRLTVDLSDAHFGELRTLLLKYRKDRPLTHRQKTIPMPPVPPRAPVHF